MRWLRNLVERVSEPSAATVRAELVAARAKLAETGQALADLKVASNATLETLVQVEEQRDAARATAQSNNQVIELLKDRLRQRDEEYDKLLIRHLSLVDTRAAQVVTRVPQAARPALPMRPTLEELRNQTVVEGDMVRAPGGPESSAEEIERRFTGESQES